MKNKRLELSRPYHAALQTYLQQGPGSSMEPARELGRKAVSLGLETLDMARMHDTALSVLVPTGTPNETNVGQLGRAGLFFAEAITPIETTHRGAREAKAHLNKIVTSLSERTLELADSVQELKQEIIQRNVVEESLRTSQATSSELLAKSLQMQEELRHLSRQLLTVQEAERQKISRELHDVIAQTLTGINVRLATLSGESKISTKDLQQKIARTQRLVEKSVDIVHRFARELRPSVLDDLGLIPALESYLKGYTEDTGIPVKLNVFADIELSDSNRRTVLYRIAQESLKNVYRHAKATQAEVSIKQSKGVITMEIKDDGQGFAVDGMSCATKTNRLGLLGMRERMEMIGGTFCIESAPGKPTTIRVELPAEKGRTKPASKKKSGSNTTLKCP